jgi:hypothetical protein
MFVPFCLVLSHRPRKLLASGFVPDVSSRLHLGSGAYASVRCLRHATSGHAYALKILEKEPLEVWV